MSSESPIRVAIDLETTGLLLESESIIEIGAVKFQGSDVLGTFESFVDPRRPIPYRIQRLTHITPPMLANAPQLADVAPKLREFLGDLPLVGHNVAFDAGFLRRFHIAERNALLDTFELASLLLPSIPSYSLESVAASLGLSAPVHHRALADAELSRVVLVALEARIAALPDPALNELCQLATPTQIPMLALLRREQQRRERQSGSPTGGQGTGTLGGLLTAQLHVNPAVLGTRVAALAAPAPDVLPVAQGDAGELPTPAPALREATRTALETGSMVVLQPAPGQRSQEEVLAEALVWATTMQRRIVIATATAAQARALYTHLLPKALGTLPATAQQVACAMLFEARDYLCPHRWYGPAREVANLSADALRGIAKMTLWMYETEHGARDEITLGPTEQVAWELTRAGTNFVALPNCAYRDRHWCFALRAQTAARAAQIVVTTHAALLAPGGLAQADLDGAYVPPAEGYLLLDAHQLTERIGIQSSWEVTSEGLLAELDMLWHRGDRQPQGLLVRAAAAIPGANSDQWSNQIARARSATTALFAALTALLAEPRSERSDENYSTALRLDAAIRALPAWGGLIEAWSDLERRLGALADTTAQAARNLAKRPGVDALALELTAESQHLRQIIRQGRESLEQPRDQFVYWVRPPQNLGWQRNRPQGATETPTLHEAPAQVALQVGPALQRLPGGVVLVGSALVVDGHFEQTRDHFGLPAVVKVQREPADCSDQTMLLVPSDAPEPNAPAYQRSLNDAIVQVARELGGQTVVLFASHTALRTTYAAIKPLLEQQDMLVLAQGIDGSLRQMWQNFRSQERVVALGAGNMWEGWESDGARPKCLFISRLPLAALNDPLLAARAEAFADPMNQFVVPYAATRLHLALNRLAWEHRERNVVVLYDRRILSKAYGATILHTLPTVTLREESLTMLGTVAHDWLNQGK